MEFLLIVYLTVISPEEGEKNIELKMPTLQNQNALKHLKTDFSLIFLEQKLRLNQSVLLKKLQ